MKFLPELHDGAAGLRLLPKRDVEGTGSSHVSLMYVRCHSSARNLRQPQKIVIVDFVA